MKLAHYLHIAPRTLFFAQGIATVVGALVQAGVTIYILTNVDGVCSTNAPNGYTCPHGRVTYSSSLIWGRILDSHFHLNCPSSNRVFRRIGSE